MDIRPGRRETCVGGEDQAEINVQHATLDLAAPVLLCRAGTSAQVCGFDSQLGDECDRHLNFETIFAWATVNAITKRTILAYSHEDTIDRGNKSRPRSWWYTAAYGRTLGEERHPSFIHIQSINDLH